MKFINPWHFICGFLMGMADSVPGISGGTVALILGIYERLVTAISHCDTSFFRLFFTGKWFQAARHIDLLFLVTLLCGIGGGIACFSHLVVHLLDHYLVGTFAAFFGLILASVLFIFRNLHAKNIAAFGAIFIGACLGWWVVGLDTLSGSESLPYVFLTGMIAICAMILPGISGAYILLVLGNYYMILQKVKSVVSLNASAADFFILLTFAVGCFLGLVCFSKILKWLLKHFHNITLALLCGCMLGSLRCLYPFQKMVKDVHGKPDFVMIPQNSITTTDYLTAGVAVVGGFLLVIFLELLVVKLTKKKSSSK
ncbi:MAG: DUF368 domain-containing protein [Planctomycetia bacterium]|nr:DUF368 domain-containing protein [Planctomycetia bacterium]